MPQITVNNKLYKLLHCLFSQQKLLILMQGKKYGPGYLYNLHF